MVGPNQTALALLLLAAAYSEAYVSEELSLRGGWAAGALVVGRQRNKRRERPSRESLAGGYTDEAFRDAFRMDRATGWTGWTRWTDAIRQAVAQIAQI